MSSWRVVRNASNNEIVLAHAKVCSSFWCHLKGLQFSRKLPPDRGLWFINKHESRSQTSIHMFFVFFTIGVIWLDSSGRVVDKALAKPWRPYYAPQSPARDFIEALPGILDRVQVGDQLVFEDPAI